MTTEKTSLKKQNDVRSDIRSSISRSVQADRELREFMWHMAAINDHLEDIRRIWAEVLGVSGPQWMILMAIGDSRSEAGISVSELAKQIRVKGTFVTAQTKILEVSGFVVRSNSAVDARIVLLSLTAKARKQIAELSARRKLLDDSIFSGISERTLNETKKTLAVISRRVEKAVLQLQLDRH